MPSSSVVSNPGSAASQRAASNLALGPKSDVVSSENAPDGKPVGLAAPRRRTHVSAGSALRSARRARRAPVARAARVERVGPEVHVETLALDRARAPSELLRALEKYDGLSRPPQVERRGRPPRPPPTTTTSDAAARRHMEPRVLALFRSSRSHAHGRSVLCPHTPRRLKKVTLTIMITRAARPEE